jgi:hypothetical protein
MKDVFSDPKNTFEQKSKFLDQQIESDILYFNKDFDSKDTERRLLSKIIHLNEKNLMLREANVKHSDNIFCTNHNNV